MINVTCYVLYHPENGPRIRTIRSPQREGTIVFRSQSYVKALMDHESDYVLLFISDYIEIDACHSQ